MTVTVWVWAWVEGLVMSAVTSLAAVDRDGCSWVGRSHRAPMLCCAVSVAGRDIGQPHVAVAVLVALDIAVAADGVADTGDRVAVLDRR